MSGSNEERPTAADETVAPRADEAATEPGTENGLKMTAAEALAMATEAAATGGTEPAASAETAEEPASAIEERAETPVDGPDEETAAPSDEAREAPASETGTAGETAEAEAAAPDADEPRDEPEAAAEPQPTAPEPPIEPEAGTPPEATAEPETLTETAAAAEPEATTEPEAFTEPEATTEDETAPEDESAAEPAETAPPTEAEADAESSTETKSGAEKPADAAPAPPPPDRPELKAVREAMSARQPIEGRVIGWNNGGFHLALGDLSAFCPRSEMEIGDVQEPESYLDKTFRFRVLRLQGKGRRIVVSRAAQLRNEKSRQRTELRKRLKPGVELEGTVASLTDFGAFVDLGGAQGLVHVSEISHRRVEHPRDALSEGQEVRVKVLKVEQGGRRISLSIRALEPDPWKDLADRFPRGAVVRGTVEKATQIGAFIELAPGLTGLLPARSMNIPRETNPARAYPPGKAVSVQIVSVDPRRQRIALALEGSGLEGSRTDYQEYKRKRREAGEGEGFNALASAFKRLEGD